MNQYIQCRAVKNQAMEIAKNFKTFESKRSAIYKYKK